MKLTKEQRKECSDGIGLECIGDPYNYKDFMIECVAAAVSRWDDLELIRWCFGEDVHPDCAFCKGKPDCKLEDYQDCQYNPKNK